MFKLHKSAILDYYSLYNVASLLIYNIVARSFPVASNTFTQLFISANLAFSSYYLLCKNNVILKGSINIKKFFVACNYEYILIWELVNLLVKSKELTIYYTKYAYFGLILLHLGLSQRYPNFFDKFIIFNFGFTHAYMATFFLQDYNFTHILICFAGGIISNYYDVITLNFMTIFSANNIYCITLQQAIFGLILYILSKLPKNNEYFFWAGCAISGVSIGFTICIFISNVKTQIENLKNKGDAVELKSEKLLKSE